MKLEEQWANRAGLIAHRMQMDGVKEFRVKWKSDGRFTFEVIPNAETDRIDEGDSVKSMVENEKEDV